MKGIHPGAWKTAGFVRRILVISLFGLASSLSLAAEYQLLDLGANVAPKDINSFSEIAGARNTDQYPNIAFRWTPATGYEDLNGTSANAINDAGVIAGTTISGAFRLDGKSYRSWDDHKALGINELGEISGSKAGKNPYRTNPLPYNPAVLSGNSWDVMDIARLYSRGTRDGVYADIYTLFDINSNGYAVGSKYRYGLAGSAAMLITPPYSSIVDITGVTFLSSGVANAINEQNIIVGKSDNESASGPYASAFLYNNGVVENLGTLTGGLRSGANDINDVNQVVGYSESSTGNHAILWDSTNGMRDLNDLVLAEGWVLSSAKAINNAGDIIGTGLLNGQAHGFLLTTGTPPPPPPVVNHPPVAVASSDVSSGKVSLEVNFSGADSSDPDGDTLTYSWDFGDGTSSTEMIPATHVYSTVGTFIAVLTVDDGGMTHSTQVEITVRKLKGGRK